MLRLWKWICWASSGHSDNKSAGQDVCFFVVFFKGFETLEGNFYMLKNLANQALVILQTLDFRRCPTLLVWRVGNDLRQKRVNRGQHQYLKKEPVRSEPCIQARKFRPKWNLDWNELYRKGLVGFICHHWKGLNRIVPSPWWDGAGGSDWTLQTVNYRQE